MVFGEHSQVRIATKCVVTLAGAPKTCHVRAISILAANHNLVISSFIIVVEDENTRLSSCRKASGSLYIRDPLCFLLIEYILYYTRTMSEPDRALVKTDE